MHYIKAHTNLSDKHSVGNSEADKLANLAVNGVLEEDKVFFGDTRSIAGFAVEPVNVPVPAEFIKNYINISYNYKDAVKKLGAKWDLNKKKWYYEDNLKEDSINSIKEIEVLSASEKEARTDSNANENCDIENSNGKVYIKIPFKNKDAVKKLGCKWDPDKKSWYYLSTTDKNKISDIMKLT